MPYTKMGTDTAVIEARNVNDGLRSGIHLLQAVGEKETSRNGAVVVAPGPVLTEYSRPRERVLLSAERDANPFFHLMEAMWMLAGRNDVAFPATYAKQIAQYSDDGVTLNGAYGWRWRGHFGFDQLRTAIEELRKNPTSRRVVIAMWDGSDLLNKHSKDLPCNTHIYFDARHGELNMTVSNRSNDIVWGLFGANAVHFSMLQEYVANCVGLPVGKYRHLSNNFHLYTETHDLYGPLGVESDNRYETGTVEPYPLVVAEPDGFDYEAFKLLERPTITTLHEPFLRHIVGPALRCWHGRKAKDSAHRSYLSEMPPGNDWRTAMVEWLDRREARNAASATA